MTDARWAERMIQFLESGMPLPVHKRRDALVKLSALLDARRKAEHARAIRIVKKFEKAAWLDKHSRTVEQRNAYTDACEDILEALQRGRGGKG